MLSSPKKIEFYKVRHFVSENSKIIFRILFTALFIFLALFFVRHEATEATEISHTLYDADALTVLFGIVITGIYIFLQAELYRQSFKAIGTKVKMETSIVLFLKRNLISVFLPGGGITSLAFFTKPLEQQKITKTQIHIASSVYAAISIFSVFIVAVPALIYKLIKAGLSSDEIYAFVGLAAFIAVLLFLIFSIIKKGIIYKLISRYAPDFEFVIDELKNKKFDAVSFVKAIMVSVFIEFAGIIHLIIAMRALNLHSNVEGAILGYLVATMFLIVSPFMRGLGAIELSLSYLLTTYGFNLIEAVSITMLYRFFEFWLPLIAGVFSFFFKKDNFLMRVFPAILLLLLGIVNLISVLTPAVASRLILLQDYLSIETINASNSFVLMAGILLIFLSVFLIKGYRLAWLSSVLVSVISFIGHITKGIDYEEAIVALFTISVLLITRKQYFRRGNVRSQWVGVKTASIAMLIALIYGITGFYFLDVKHFGIDFSISQSVRSTFHAFFLFSANVLPLTTFARDFVYSINFIGASSILFMIYTIAKPFVTTVGIDESEHKIAQNLVKLHGNSALDYFKTYFDKLLFFNNDKTGFIAYRVASGFAVALEKPVCADIEAMKELIISFDKYCLDNDLKSAWYRVDESLLPVFHSLKKKSIIVGQEAVVDLTTFSMEGGSRKSLRNAVKSTHTKGFNLKVYEPPVKDGVLQRLKAVSDEWLHATDYTELVFSQGVFDLKELKNQTILALESDDEKIIAFSNIIPDYVKDEGTYDLIRKTSDAPGTTLDCLMIETFNYFKSKNYTAVNIGMAPMAGLEHGEKISEKTVKFAYEKLKQFRHYQSLRDYKNKFDPQWHTKFLVYENSYDLILLPAVLNKIIKP